MCPGVQPNKVMGFPGLSEKRKKFPQKSSSLADNCGGMAQMAQEGFQVSPATV